MADRGHALLRPFAAVGAKWIGGYVNICPSSVLMCEPCEVTGSERSPQLDDSLNRCAGGFTPQKESDGFPRRETTGKEINSGGGCIRSIRLWHGSPRRRARSGSA